MEHPHNLVVVGSNAETPAKFFTQLEPIKLNENVGMAIKSIFHGSINNVTQENKKIPFIVQVDFNSPPERVQEVLEIEEGNYSSTLAVIQAINIEFLKSFGTSGGGGASRRGGAGRKNPRIARLVKPNVPPFIEIDKDEIDENGNGFITIIPRHMVLIFNKESPWSIIEKRDLILLEDEELRIKNIDFSKTIQPTFLYSNIVENSYINGKLSRNLSTIPLSMNSGWNFHEFNNPVYVSIDVKQFSKIVIELRDMDGKYIKFDPAFKTVINLHIKPINRSA